MNVSSNGDALKKIIKEFSLRLNILLIIYLSTPPVTKERFCLLIKGF